MTGSGKENLMLTSVSMTSVWRSGALRGAPRRGGSGRLALVRFRSFDFALWAPLRMTQGQGCSEGEASPLGYNFLSLCA